MAIEGVFEQGWATTKLDDLINWARYRFDVADDFRSCLLRRRDDARGRLEIRS